MWNWMEMPENAKLHQQRLFHCLITFSSEIDNRGRLVFGRAAHRHNNVRLSAIQKPSKSPRTLEYVITLKFYRWTLSRKNKHRPMASARCLSLSLCCIHIFHRLKCFSHSWKLLERDVRERKESGRWELRPKKKKEAFSLPSIHYSSIVYLNVCIFCPLSSSSLLHLSLHLFVTAACNSSFFGGGTREEEEWWVTMATASWLRATCSLA